MKLLSFAQGWRTYGAIAAGVALGIAQHFGVQVPWWASIGLLAFGAASLRASVTAETAKTADDMAALLGTILPAISSPEQAAALPAAVKLPSGRTVIIGQPTPAGIPPTVVTGELNRAEAAQ